ncbi:CDP-glycerol glycerophosphotransferase family protein [Pediococcus stilesii]|uniref:CDP-glycerol poly(Glycerophosphate) glycerophosphotransferase n=1 Tax=Pediococcus stilesii TaxID=331679 RepID=A0A0R2L4A7_9LACO|nr:CDP-glycerol glycerophosphotransferase family protein [Pediococcus stilesii]KRN94090.1 CDP-glycerol poly(glycerophosphate) glycerophosphotransferase [Pediococcus stilesii]
MNSLKKTIKIWIRYGLIGLNSILTLLPTNEKRVLFESFNGKGLTDNPKAIYDQMVNDFPDATGQLFWGVKGQLYGDLTRKYPEAKIVKRWSLKWIWISATARFWIFNSRMPTWWKKNKRTVYVQTWHGTPLKHLALDMEQVKLPGNSREKYLTEFVKEAQRWDYLIAANQYSETIFKRAFKFQNVFLETGYPRNDVLIQKNTATDVKNLKRRMVGNPNLRVITYAPTWREDDFISVGHYHFRWHFRLEKIMNALPDDTILLIRPHYLVTDKIDISGFEDRVIIDSESDMNEIYLITDVMITDYSSVMFDFSILKRPMLFFAYDLDYYRDDLRGFYFDYYTELPGPIVQNEDELLEQIRSLVKTDFKEPDPKRFNQFAERFVSWEKGTAAKQVIQKVGYGGIVK